MFFNEVYGIESTPKNIKIIERKAVRAVVIKDNKLLMVDSKVGDLKLPGGGVNSEEGYAEALVREVEEETGYVVKEVKDKIGIVVETHPDRFGEDALFRMVSMYYLCDLSGEIKEQNLDTYEKELEFKSVWVTFDEAITVNTNIINNGKANDYTVRETKVLELLKKHLG